MPCTDAVSSRGAADEPIAARPGEINQLILLAAEENGPAERIKAPLLIIVARDDANADGLRLPDCPISVRGLTRQRTPRN